MRHTTQGPLNPLQLLCILLKRLKIARRDRARAVVLCQSNHFLLVLCPAGPRPPAARRPLNLLKGDPVGALVIGLREEIGRLAQHLRQTSREATVLLLHPGAGPPPAGDGRAG